MDAVCPPRISQAARSGGQVGAVGCVWPPQPQSARLESARPRLHTGRPGSRQRVPDTGGACPEGSCPGGVWAGAAAICPAGINQAATSPGRSGDWPIGQRTAEAGRGAAEAGQRSAGSGGFAATLTSMSERIPIRIDNRSHKLDGAAAAAAAAAAADVAAAPAPDRGSADEQLGDLDRVERCAFAEVVVADEQRKATSAVDRRVDPDPADIGRVLAGGLERGGHIEQLDAGC